MEAKDRSNVTIETSVKHTLNPLTISRIQRLYLGIDYKYYYKYHKLYARHNMVKVIGGQLLDITNKVDSDEYIFLECEGDMLDAAGDFFDLDEEEGGFLL